MWIQYKWNPHDGGLLDRIGWKLAKHQDALALFHVYQRRLFAEQPPVEWGCFYVSHESAYIQCKFIRSNADWSSCGRHSRSSVWQWPSVYHTPGCSTSFGNFSASGVLGESQSVGGPNVYECGNPRNINPFDAAIDYKLSNVRNYWRVYLWCAITGKTWNVSPDNGNGSIKVTGLNPESSYKITTKVVDRNGTVQYTGGVYASFTTPADQLKIAFNQGGRVKVARVYYNHNGTIKKVKKVYRNINGSVKKGVNYG